MLAWMSVSATRRPTWADLESLPDHVVGELIRSALHVSPRPRPREQSASTVLGAELHGPFQRGRGGPGGWRILSMPGLAFPPLDVEEIVPDLAGWRRERLPALPERSIEVVPDWVCEVLSPATRQLDLRVKRPLYAELGVPHMWVVDVEARTVVVSRNEVGRWMEIGVWADSERVRAEPFDAIELALSDLWEDGTPTL